MGNYDNGNNNNINENLLTNNNIDNAEIKENNSNNNIDNSKIQENNSLPNIQKKQFIWIDENINNKENVFIYNYLFENDETLNCKKFETISDSIDYILENEDIHFHKITIIISGRLFIDLYKISKIYNDRIKISPIIIVFLTNKECFINNLKIMKLYYNNDLFDNNLIFNEVQSLKNYINGIIIEEEELTFESVENYEQLIIPNYYPHLMEEVTQTEIYLFNEYIMNHFNKDIQDLISQIKDNRYISKEIVCKYWMRIYTLENDFFKTINKELRKKKGFFAYPLIKMCYEGIKKNILKPVYNKNIYRGSTITKEELDKIKNMLSRKDNSGFPKAIVYSRCFLSFSEEERQALFYARKTEVDNIKYFNVLYILEKMDIKNIDINNISNASIKEYSRYKSEKEVLIFPFSCFEVIRIGDDEEDKTKDYLKIYLKYLGNYGNLIKEQVGDKLFKEVPRTKFADELTELGIIKYNFTLSWIVKKIGNEDNINFCFLLDNNEDCVTFINNQIKIINVDNNEKEKLNIDLRNEILSIIKLKDNRICSNSKDRTIKIIKLIDNNEKYELLQNIELKDKYVNQMVFLSNCHISFLENEQTISFYSLQENNYIFNESINIKDKIKIIKELSDDKLLFVIANYEFSSINFLDLKTKKDIKNIINIKKKIIDLINYESYFIIIYDFTIDIFDYISEEKKISTFYLDNKLTNIIRLSNNKFIVGLYNNENNENIIRELKICFDGKKINLDCIGEGKSQYGEIKNIIKYSESKILANLKDNSFVILEKYYENNESYKTKYIENNTNEQNEDQKEEINNEIKIENKEMKINKKINESINNEIKEDKKIKINEEEEFESKATLNSFNNNINLNISISCPFEINNKKDNNINNSINELQKKKKEIVFEMYTLQKQKKIKGNDNAKIENEINEKNKYIKNIEEQIEELRRISYENIKNKNSKKIKKYFSTSNIFSYDEKDLQEFNSTILDISSNYGQSEKNSVSHKNKKKEKVLIGQYQK